MGSGGVDSQLNSIYWCMNHIWAVLFSLGFVVSLILETGEGKKNFWTSSVSTLALALIYLLIVLFCARLTKLSQKKVNEMRRSNEHANSVSAYLIYLFCAREHAKDIRVYSMKQYLKSLYHKYCEECMGMYLDWGKTEGRYASITGLLTQLAAGIAYAFLAAKAYYGVINYGEIFIYAGAINRLGDAVQRMINEYIIIVYRMEYLKLYTEFINQIDMLYDGTLPVEKRDDAMYEFEFQNVSFCYPGTEEYVLKHLNLKFKVGSKMAIVGRNGAGKSTIVKLLCRLYEPTEGKILLNGIDISYYDYKEYVNIFSVVFQEHKVFSFPVGENLSGSEQVDEARA